MITQEESSEIKGIAILMMLFLHLFNTPERIELCTTTLHFWNGKPLVYAMTRAMGFCVPIYIFLSGYGLSVTYERSKEHQLRTASRLLSLYANLWIISLIFIPLGYLFRPDIYPGDLLTLLGNLSGISTTYNYEWWFLFPYVLLVCFAPRYIRHIHRQTGRQAFHLLIQVCLLSFAIQLLRKVVPVFAGRQMIIWYFTLLFPFLTGIVFARFDVFKRCKNYWEVKIKDRHRNGVLCILMLMLCLLRMTIGPSMYNPLFATLFLVLFVSTTRPQALSHTLQFLGRHSTNMWLTHTFFSWYLFSEYFYALKYPLLIYAALLAVSLSASILIQRIYSPLRKRIRQIPF